MSRRHVAPVAATAAVAAALLVAPVSAEMVQSWSWATWAGPGSGIIMGPGAMSRILLIDRNGDGFVEKIEMAEHMRAVFTVSDADGNGGLSLAEYLAVRTASGQVLDQAKLDSLAETRTAHFRAMDLNSDGLLSPGEYFDGAEALFRSAGGAHQGRVAWPAYGAMDAQ